MSLSTEHEQNWARRITYQRHDLGPRGPYESLYNYMVSNNKRKGRTVFLSYEEFLPFTLIDRCHYCNAHVEWGEPYGQRHNRYNLDRKDNALDYPKDNCAVCCKSCNYTKSDKLSYEEMLVVGQMRRDVREAADLLTIPCSTVQ